MSGNLLLSTIFDTVRAEHTFPLHDFLGLNLSLQDSTRAPGSLELGSKFHRWLIPKPKDVAIYRNGFDPMRSQRGSAVPFLNLRGGVNDPSFGEKHIVAVDFERFL